MDYQEAQKIMERIKIILQIIGLLVLVAFAFISFLNYQANLGTYLETKKIAEFIQNNLTIDETSENKGDEQSDQIEEETCCTLH